MFSPRASPSPTARRARCHKFSWLNTILMARCFGHVPQVELNPTPVRQCPWMDRVTYTSSVRSKAARFLATRPSLPPHPDNVFVALFGPDGNLLWVRQTGGFGQDIPQGVVPDQAGNLYVAGYFVGSPTFGPTTLVSA